MAKRKAKRMMGTHESASFYAGGELVSRVCTHCGENKLISEYHRNGVDENGKPAYRLECKTCYNAKRKENKNSNKHAEFVGHQRSRGEKDIEYTYTEWREAVIFFGGECAYCGATMRRNQTLTRDHLMPVSKGGKTVQGNIVPACGCCNSSKGNQDFKDWFMKQSFFSQERLNRIFKWRNIIRVASGEVGEVDD